VKEALHLSAVKEALKCVSDILPVLPTIFVWFG
jgi:hypothetical protein